MCGSSAVGVEHVTGVRVRPPLQLQLELGKKKKKKKKPILDVTSEEAKPASSALELAPPTSASAGGDGLVEKSAEVTQPEGRSHRKE